MKRFSALMTFLFLLMWVTTAAAEAGEAVTAPVNNFVAVPAADQANDSAEREKKAGGKSLTGADGPAGAEISPAGLSSSDDGGGANFQELMMSEIIVSAGKANSDPYFSPSNITLISAEKIRTSSPTMTPDLFNYAPGILVQKTNHGGGSPFIRGMTGKQILLMVDGVRINNALFRSGPHQYLNTIDPFSLERIEVIHGPYSVVHGSDALGGVVNLISRERNNFGKDYGVDVLLNGRYGNSDNSHMANAQTQGNIHDFGFWVGGSYKVFEDLRGGRSVGVQPDTGYREWDAGGALKYNFGKAGTISLKASHVEQQEVPKTSETTLSRPGESPKLKYVYDPQKRTIAYLRYEGDDLPAAIFDTAKATFNVQYFDEGEDIIGNDPMSETIEESKDLTLGGRLEFSRDIGYYGSKALVGGLIEYGAEYYRDSIESEKIAINHFSGKSSKTASTYPPQTEYGFGGGWLQGSLRVSEYFRMILGGRYSRYDASAEVDIYNSSNTRIIDHKRQDYSFDDLTGAAGIIISPFKHMNIVMNVAQGFRAPNMEDLYPKIDFDESVPNPDIRPEKSINYELGIKVRHPYFRASVFGYQARYYDLIDRVDAGEGKKTTDNLSGVSIISGFEANLSLLIYYNLEINSTVSYTHGEDADGNPLRRMPPWMGSGAVHFTSRLGFYEVGMRWAAEQKRLSGSPYGLTEDGETIKGSGDMGDPRIGPEGTPGYAVIDLRFGQDFADGRQRIILSIENLLDENYKTHGSGVMAAGTNVKIDYSFRF